MFRGMLPHRLREDQGSGNLQEVDAKTTLPLTAVND